MRTIQLRFICSTEERDIQSLFPCLLSISHSESGSLEAEESTLQECGPGDGMANKTEGGSLFMR